MGEKDDTVVKLCNESPFMMIKQEKKYPAHNFLPIIIQSKNHLMGANQKYALRVFLAQGLMGFFRLNVQHVFSS